MKKILPATTIIGLLIFFIYRDLPFKSKHDNTTSNLKFTSSDFTTSSNLHDDTTNILNHLCERAISNNVSVSTGLDITNYLPCAWNEDFSLEKKGAVSAYSEVNRLGIIEMALLINELPYVISKRQLKDIFSLERIKNVAEKSMAISYRKVLLSGLDCQEIIFKKDNLIEAPGATSYSIHFETIFKNKYVTLSYSVAYNDINESKRIFYQYLPIFRTLSQKFKISN